jgi:hypothetical protein
MRLLPLLLLVSGLTSGCTRLHAVTPDANGGVYFVAKKHTLGIGGKQTLVFCATPQTCGTVVASNEVSDLGPAPIPSNNSSDAFGGLLGGLLGGDSGAYDGINDLEGLYGGGSDSWETPTPVDCPEDAIILDSPIPAGTRVSLIAIHQDDAYAGSEYEADLPITGTVDGDLHGNDGCWAGGGFDADSGQNFYFYKAAFRFE